MLYIYLFLLMYIYIFSSAIISYFTKINFLPFGSAIARDIRENKKDEFIKRIAVYFWISIIIFIIAIPLLWMISVAFTPGLKDDFRDVSLVPNPFEWKLDNFKQLFSIKENKTNILPDYWNAFLRTLLIAIINTVSVVVVSGLTGIALARYKFKIKKVTLLTMMILQLFPSFLALLALFFLFKTLGIYNKPIALVFIYTAMSVPYNAFIVRGYLRNIPKSLDEAAEVDGASNIKLLVKIILPLSLPIFGFLAVGAFMTPWMDYILASQLLHDKETIATFLFKFTDKAKASSGARGFNPRLFFAGALFLTVPIMLLQMYMQKYIISGLMAGADKG